MLLPFTNVPMEELFIKYIIGAATGEELDVLGEWVEDPKNAQAFEDFVKLHYQLILTMNHPDIESIKESLRNEIKKEKDSYIQKKGSRFLIYAAAAVIIVLISIPLAKQWIRPDGDGTVDSQYEILPGTDKATLTLGNGSMVALEKGVVYKSEYASGNGEGLVYSNEKSKSVETVYNYLSVPRGGEFFVQLSDGTSVWLNSETKIRFPVSFEYGKPREVDLIYGEAYFDVSKSSNNGGSFFRVHSQQQSIEVTGTKFNIEAYSGSPTIYTTLVEGKVYVASDFERIGLEPGQQARLDAKSGRIEVVRLNVFNATSWKDGIFAFQDDSLEDIMGKLSRWYDIDVLFVDGTKKDMIFSGHLSRYEKVNELLEKFELTNTVQFETDGKTVRIK